MGEFLVSLKEITLSFGGAPVLDKVSLSISRGMRAALTGRNGEGKSTLFKVLSGELEPDCGEIVRAPAVKILYVPQSVPADREGDDVFNSLSGGGRRRKILEDAILSHPDVLLLDEPTNHLDMEAIDWLEGMIRRQRDMAVMIVTHDRRFLKRVATRIFDLDRGELSGWECDYATFVRRKAELLSDEAVYWERKTKKLAQEEAWIRRGVKARTTRNEGRVAALLKLREEFAARRNAPQTASIKIDTASPGGVRVIKIEDVSFSYSGSERPIVRDFTADVLRGERIGILGGNGAGKTTLIKLLTGIICPDAGSITLGTNVQLAFLDQLRTELDENQTVAENIATDRDEVVVGGVRKHVYSYLSDFLFTSDRARTPVKALSGGERARLMLAKLFLQPANLLVMDEPTNDLDIETLELLEEQLMAYKGTLLLVSHDREFLDNVVTSTFVLEGDGRVCSYPGGYADYLKQRKDPDKKAASPHAAEKPSRSDEAVKRKLSFNEKRELDALPAKIEELEAKVQKLTSDLAAGRTYSSDELDRVQSELEQAVERWAQLEERNG